jgi:deoxyribonuclease V
VCTAVDVHYLSTGEAGAAAVLAADAAFAPVLADRTAMVSRVPAYRPGEFYRRELAPLRAVLGGLSGLGPLVVDGYADLDPGGRPGLGAQAHAEFGIAVIGVAEPRFRTATRAVPVLRGSSVRPFHQAIIGTPPLSRDSPIPFPPGAAVTGPTWNDLRRLPSVAAARPLRCNRCNGGNGCWRASPRGSFHASRSYCSKNHLYLEPVSGFEPLTCRLQEVRPAAACARAAPMARVIALTAPIALGLPAAPVHEPVHGRGSCLPSSCYRL